MIGAIIHINADYSIMDSCDRDLFIRVRAEPPCIIIEAQRYWVYTDLDEITENYLAIKYPHLILKLKDN